MTDPAQKVADLERAMAALTDLVNRLPTQDDADRAVRVERQVNRMMAFAIVPTLLTLASIVIVLFVAFETKDSAEANRGGVRCVLEQLAEHRQANHLFNETIARQVGAPMPPKGDYVSPPAVVEELVKACEPYYPDNGPSLRGP